MEGAETVRAAIASATRFESYMNRRRVVMASGPVPTCDKVRDHRAGMRAKDRKLADTGSAEFKAEARRQSRLIARSPHDTDDQAFLDSVSSF